MTYIERKQAIEAPDTKAIRAYWKFPTSAAAPGLVELAQLHINELCDFIEALPVLPLPLTRPQLDSMIERLLSDWGTTEESKVAAKMWLDGLASRIIAAVAVSPEPERERR